jgi:hypothetical protein
VAVTSLTAGTGGVTIGGTATVPIINVPQAVTSITGSGSATIGGTATVPNINVPVAVTSLTAGTGGVTIGGTATVPVINVPAAVTSVTQGTNIRITGGSLTPTINVANPLVLSSPLTLPSATSTVITQQGFNQAVTYSGPVTGTSIANDTVVTYGSTTITQQGVYLVSCQAQIDLFSAGLQLLNVFIEATNVTFGSGKVFYIPFNGSTISGSMIAPLTSVIVVPASVTSVVSLRIYTGFSGGSLGTNTNSYQFFITRVA